VAALRRRVEAGLTLLVASHAPALLAAADTVLRLEDGRGVRDDCGAGASPALA
jgi:ABC-type transport system involved in cytochrome bd biosynthesis fused ATPase/permease subunit